jgi:hypothetical protein
MSDATANFIADTIVATFAGLIAGLLMSVMRPEAAGIMSASTFALSLAFIQDWK